MKIPVILSYKTLKKSGELNETYLKAIECCGGNLIMLETLAEIDSEIDSADGILLPGGIDVDPQLYGEECKNYTQSPNKERDMFEIYLLEKAIAKRIPVLGICRGFQLINVTAGGTLYQDIQHERPGSLRHDYHEDESLKLLPRSTLAHSVSLEENSKIYESIGCKNITVNSLHHQGIRDLGKNLIATGHTPDGLIEAFELQNYPYLVGVQWHPEELMTDFACKNFIAYFIKACSE